MIKSIKKRSKKFCLAGVAAAALCGALPVSGAFAQGVPGELNIVKIDTNRVLEMHPAFIEAQAEFEKRLQEMQQELESLPAEEQMMARQMMEQEVQQLALRLQEEAVGQLRSDMAEIAAAKGYDYIMDSNLLIVGGVDVTEEIIAEIDK